MVLSPTYTNSKQEHPRRSIVEPQGLHQDGLNSLKIPQLSLHMCTIFSIAKEKKLKLGQVGVGSNIAQNHSSSRRMRMRSSSRFLNISVVY